MSLKLNKLDVKVKTPNPMCQKVERASSFISDKYDQKSKEFSAAQAQVKSLLQSCKTFNYIIKIMSKNQETINTKMLDIEILNTREK